MKLTRKLAFIYALALILSISFAIQFASAATPEPEVEVASQLSEEELDRVLAPIALYPDTLLTHILIASTYPMDVIRAARWREKNDHLDSEEVLERVEVFSWDPSVKALTPFEDVLTQMSEDLDWLNYLGDSVIADEEWVLSRIQVLRDQAYANGALDNNEYVNVEREDDVIVIEPVREKIVYVPYYDTRVVYGPWWHVRSPYYWHHPRHYRYRSGFYWSPSIHIASHFFFGGFHWHHGYVVVDHGFHRHYRNGFHYGYKRVYSKSYKRWRHNVNHRRARYHDRVVHYPTHRNIARTKVVRNRELNSKRYGAYQAAEPLKVTRNKRQLHTANRTLDIKRERTVTRKNGNSVTRSTQVKREASYNPNRDRTFSKQKGVNREKGITRQRDVVRQPSKSRTSKTTTTTKVKREVSKQSRNNRKTVVKQRNSSKSFDRNSSRSVQRSSSKTRSVSKPSRSQPKQSRSSKQVSRHKRN
jgi:hypothetical protein